MIALFMLSTLGFLAFIVIGLISLIRKSEKTKRNFMIAGACFVVMIISFIAVPVPEAEEAAADPQENVVNVGENDIEEVELPTENENEPIEETKPAEENTPPAASKPVEVSEKDEIKKAVEQIIKDDLKSTTINKIDVNQNFGLDDGSYIVLPHLNWDVKNREKTTREMLEMYSDHLAAKLADYNVSEVTVFWEVPYHLDGENSAKMNYQRQGDGMAIGERWYAPVLRD